MRRIGLHQVTWRAGVLVASVSLIASPAKAQDVRQWTLGMGLGLARAGLTGGGSATAVRTNVAMARPLSRRAQALVSFEAYSMDAAEAIPGCVPGAQCETRTTQPSLLLGPTAGIAVQPFAGGLSLALMGGGYYGPTIKGTQPRSTAAWSGSVDYELPWKSRFTPTIGFRYVRMTTPLANVRWLAGPGGGMAF